MSGQQKAIVSIAPKIARLVNDRPIPKLRDGYILVRNKAVALNPSDWKSIDRLATPGALVGCDYAGVVEAVSSTVSKEFKKGDKVAGLVQGINQLQPEDGAFAEYIVAKGDVQIKLPEWISFEEATTLGSGVTTVGQGLYQVMGLELPETGAGGKGEPVFIYGGSSATGSLGIQFAKLSGYTVITTCSPHNFDFVKSLGATHVYDYNQPDAAQQIREITNNKLMYAWDTISSASSSKFCGEALTSGPGAVYGALVKGAESPREDVKFLYNLAYTALGEPMNWNGQEIPARPEDLEYAAKWLRLAEKLIEERKIKPHPGKVGKDGLLGVLDGLEQMRQGKVSGQKLVYRIEDTP